LILEDEWPARNYLAELLQASGLAEVAGAAASLDAARELLASPSTDLPLDVVFVDVRLAGEPSADAGLTLVRQYAGLPHAPQFVIASAFKQHTLEAFELGVVDYLVKPFSEERVRRCLDRLLGRRPVRSGGSTRIAARHKASLVFLALDEVWAIQAAERLAFVHTPLGRFDLDLSLASIEATCGSRMMRVHRNWLVNVAHVREFCREGAEATLYVGPGIAPSNAGIRVPIARDRAKQVRETLLATATGLRSNRSG
jgi:DNA-binding LytR/AlgR family response regulator